MVVLEQVGLVHEGNGRIIAVIWEGTTTAGDTAVLAQEDGKLLWRGRTDKIQTYLGANFGPTGIEYIGGFKLMQLSSGTVFVYIKKA